MLDDNIKYVLNQLLQKGYDTRLVGGYVRDYLNQRVSNDVDIATIATPSEVFQVFSNSQFKVIPSGMKYGSVSLLINNDRYQITTLRKDVVCYGRDAEVVFSKSFKEDSYRRDFTFNAIYMDIDGEILDFHGGAEDLKNGFVKFIGDPAEKMIQDYLRILRFFRFWGEFAKDGLNKYAYVEIIKSLSDKVSNLSKDRIREEFLKILATTNVVNVLYFMDETDVLRHILSYDLSKIEAASFGSASVLEKLAILSKDDNIKFTLNLSNNQYSIFKKFYDNFK